MVGSDIGVVKKICYLMVILFMSVISISIFAVSPETVDTLTKGKGIFKLTINNKNAKEVKINVVAEVSFGQSDVRYNTVTTVTIPPSTVKEVFVQRPLFGTNKFEETTNYIASDVNARPAITGALISLLYTMQGSNKLRRSYLYPVTKDYVDNTLFVNIPDAEYTIY